MSNTVNSLLLQPEQFGISHPASSVPQAVTGNGNMVTTQIKSPAIPLNGESLELTDSAQALQKMRSGGGPSATPVNTEHVERIRQAIANNSYEINTERMVEKFLLLERGIGIDKKA